LVSRNAIEKVSQILIAFSQLFDAGKSSSPIGAVRKTSNRETRRARFFELTLSGFGKIVDA
jgi:hypothetical protein